jgi:hypothetical protein
VAPCLAALAATTDSSGPVAQWIRHRPTEPGIAGSSPAGVIAADPIQTAQSIHAPKLKLAITAPAHVEQVHYGSAQAPPRLDSV